MAKIREPSVDIRERTQDDVRIENNIFEKYRKAVCLIQTKEGDVRGTGCFIGGQLLLTANHVVPDEATAEKCKAVVFQQLSTSPTPPPSMDLLPNECFAHSGFNEICGKPQRVGEKLSNPGRMYLDYTIVAVEPHPHLLSIQSSVLSLLESPKPIPKSNCFIFHYPYTFNGQQTLAAQLNFHRIVIQHVETNWIDYDLEGRRGSSGGPVVDEQGNLIGLHYLDVGKQEYEPTRPFSTSATLTSRIVEHLKQSNKFVEIESKTQDLSPFVKSVRGKLEKWYENQSTLTILLTKDQGPWMLEDAFIENHYSRLNLIREEERENRKEKIASGQLTWKRQFKAERSVELKDLFEIEKIRNAQRKHIRVIGAAGIGKTTFCQRIVSLWRQGGLWPHYLAVFWVRLKNLSSEKHKTKYDILATECGCNAQELEELLKSPELRDRMLLILDGGDELPKEAGKEKHQVGSLAYIYQELKGDFNNIILTTRPWNTDFTATIQVEILGFDPDSIRCYTSKFFKKVDPDGEKGEKLLSLFDGRPLMYSLAHVPMSLSMMCVLMHEDSGFFKSGELMTTTALYQKIVRRFYQWYSHSRKNNDLGSVLKEEYSEKSTYARPLQKALEKIAWSNQIELNSSSYIPQLFVEDVFGAEHLDLETAKNMGLLNMEKGSICFVHLSFQEYFAACYLASLYKDNLVKAAKAIAIPRVKEEFIFRTTAGLLSLPNMNNEESKKSLISFFQDLVGVYKDEALSNRLEILAVCFNECQSGFIDKEYQKFIKLIIDYLDNLPVFEIAFHLLNKNPKILHDRAIIEWVLEKLKKGSPDRDQMICFIYKLAEDGQLISSEIIQSIITAIDDPQYPFERASGIKAIATIAKGTSKLPEDLQKVVRKAVDDPMSASCFATMQAKELLQQLSRENVNQPQTKLSLQSTLNAPTPLHRDQTSLLNTPSEVVKLQQKLYQKEEISDEEIKRLVTVLESDTSDFELKALIAQTLGLVFVGQKSAKALEGILKNEETVARGPDAENTMSKLTTKLGELPDWSESNFAGKAQMIVGMLNGDDSNELLIELISSLINDPNVLWYAKSYLIRILIDMNQLSKPLNDLEFDKRIDERIDELFEPEVSDC